MNKEDFIRFFWRQYNLCEKDLINTADYVTICKQNYSSFSNRYQQIFFGICSELDAISNEIYGEEKLKNFPSRMSAIFEKCPDIRNKRVTTRFPYETINLVPFANFSKDDIGNDKSASWWQHYNDLKHNRVENNGSGRFNYQNANLENTLSALAALYILNLEMAKKCCLEEEETERLMKSNLFYVS